MSLIVLSQCYYLKVAFSVLYSEMQYKDDTCVIDLDSFPTLNDIANVLRGGYTGKSSSVILVGSRAGINSKLMLPLQVNFICSSVNSFRGSVSGKYYPETILEHISECRSLCRLSEPELWLSGELRMGRTLREIAHQNYINMKTLYGLISRAAAKYNLRSGKTFLFFLNNEFRSGRTD